MCGPTKAVSEQTSIHRHMWENTRKLSSLFLMFSNFGTIKTLWVFLLPKGSSIKLWAQTNNVI